MVNHGKEAVLKVLKHAIAEYGATEKLTQLNAMVENLDEDGLSAFMCMCGADSESINNTIKSIEHTINKTKISCQQDYGVIDMAMYELNNTLENLTFISQTPNLPAEIKTTLLEASSVVEVLFRKNLNISIVNSLLRGVGSCELQEMKSTSLSDVREKSSQKN